MRDPSRPSGPRLVDLVLYLVGVGGFAAALTLLFLGMRAVMDVGGYCAEGGAYVIQQHCPEGAPLATLLGFIVGFSSPFLVAWKGSSIGGGWGSIAFLAWPAAFGALGYNFLEYGLNPPGDDPGWAWGWLFCGALFEAMALIPLFLGIVAFWTGLRGRAPAGPSRAIPGALTVGRFGSSTVASAEVAKALRLEGDTGLSTSVLAAGAAFSPDLPDGRPGARPAGGLVDALGPGPDAAAGGEALVDGLERLAALHDDGALTDEEYARAKAGLLEREA